jgi:hypothetical protein
MLKTPVCIVSELLTSTRRMVLLRMCGTTTWVVGDWESKMDFEWDSEYFKFVDRKKEKTHTSRLLGDSLTLRSKKSPTMTMMNAADVDQEVFQPIHQVPNGHPVLPCSDFVKEKYDGAGILLKLKARMVAGGHYQHRHVTIKTSSPTVNDFCLAGASLNSIA